VVSYEIDWSDPYSLHNWVEKLDLVCAPGWKLGMIGSVVFIGWVLTLAWVPRLSDMYGRKYIFMIGMLADLSMFICIFFTKSLNWMIVIFFVIGLATTSRVDIGFVYMMELVPKRNQIFYASLYNIFEGSILLIATVYFWVISKDWFWFVMIGFALQVFNFIAIQFLPESPRLLVELGRLDEARVAFEKIAKWNGKELHWDEEYLKKTENL
jgi:MFS family permease